MAQGKTIDPAAKGAQIANHPSFGLVSKHGDDLIASVAEALGPLTTSQVQQLKSDLESCDQHGDCEALVQQRFGLEPKSAQPIVDALEQIQRDVGLVGAPGAERRDALGYAQFYVDGEGSGSALLQQLLPDPGLRMHGLELR